MKRKELIVVIGVAILSAIISIIISGAIFGSPKKNPIKVVVVTKISPEFPTPQTDDQYKAFFNSDANNPTKVIEIGNTSNTQPFQDTNQ